MKLTVTKKQMIEAVATENLEAGSFFDQNDENLTLDECPVCAVGSILRKLGVQKFDDKGFADEIVDGPATVDSPNQLEGIINSNYSFLSKLSCEFENAFIEAFDKNTTREEAMDIARFHAISVIEAIGPKSIEVVVRKNPPAYSWSLLEYELLGTRENYQ